MPIYPLSAAMGTSGTAQEIISTARLTNLGWTNVQKAGILVSGSKI